MLVLPATALDRLHALARAAAPAECCGLLIGRDTADGRRVTALAPVPNDTRERYAIPAARFLATERHARAQGTHVCGVYHSHPAGPAQPSPLDVALAWPGLDYVIVDGAGAVRAWRLQESRRGFDEVPIRTTTA